MTTRQIALQVMAVRGLNTDDAALVLTITRCAGASLRNYRNKGDFVIPLRAYARGRAARGRSGFRDAARHIIRAAETAFSRVRFWRSAKGTLLDRSRHFSADVVTPLLKRTDDLRSDPSR
jgi:hypothetical protein